MSYKSRKNRDDINAPGYCGSFSAQNNQLGGLGSALRLLKRLIRPVRFRTRNFIVSIICSFRQDYQGIKFVDPLLIKFTVNKYDSTLKRNDMWHFGSVLCGDWDQNGHPIDTYGHISDILRQRMQLGKDYYEIPEFLANLELIADGETPDNCSSEAQYIEKWGRIEQLYLQIEKEGYKSQAEIKSKHPYNEIRVQVSREGRLLFEEGIHRLVIAQLLQVKKVPVLITRRHSSWVENNRKKVFMGTCDNEE